MFVRGCVGAVVGALAGLGFLLSWRALPPSMCSPTGRGGFCLGNTPAVPFLVLLWAIVAAVLLACALRLTGPRPLSSAAAGLGCVLWPVLGGSGWMLGLVAGSDVAKVLVPTVGYALAAAFTGRRASSSAHDEAGPPAT